MNPQAVRPVPHENEKNKNAHHCDEQREDYIKALSLL
ncbi:hypothetical protein NIES4071_48430 [Calothrix sp. NIES-4071]|nr:hypothetical protein NIES4071_48430 [Calothrix sp. NIES-4071]BAZ59155.1 hypothetical protein NIES4105_48370 [Calothrix sp. NIES-4105]